MSEISSTDSDHLAPAIGLLRAGQFDQARDVVAKLEPADVAANGELALLLSISRAISQPDPAAHLTPELIRHGRIDDVIKLMVQPLIADRQPDKAVAVLDQLIAAVPESAKSFRMRATLHGSQKRWTEAIRDADEAARLDPSEATLAAQIQYRIMGGRAEEAAEITRTTPQLPADERLLNLMVLSLIRSGQKDEAADLAEQIDLDLVLDPGLAGNIVQALFRAGRLEQAISVGEEVIQGGIDGPSLRSHLAQAWFAGGSISNRFAKAIEHLEFGVQLAPEDVRMISMLGDLLLRTGQTERAIPYLRKTLELKPDLSQVRALFARALKQAGNFDEAAEQFAKMTSTAADGGGRWQRYAAGALSQAGRTQEATDMFDAWVSKRRKALPSNFGAGLEALWDKVDDLNIPKARLDWAWSLRSPDCDLHRHEWDRRAKWGHLADHYLLDWLECRDDLAHEAMEHFADELDRAEEFIGEARNRSPGNGVVFASAHVGAMYFGPLALELIGERSRWLASTPSVARTAYSETLISTSDQTDIQVARLFMQALRQDYVVVVAADGAINLGAPRIPFEGQEITFTQFSARTAHRIGSASAFVAPVWRPNNHLGFMLEHLPMPEEGESPDAYGKRWQDAYLSCLRKFLALPPENLRLSGGIWRHIR